MTYADARTVWHAAIGNKSKQAGEDRDQAAEATATEQQRSRPSTSSPLLFAPGEQRSLKGVTTGWAFKGLKGALPRLLMYSISRGFWGWRGFH
jgi:hypothetical protein